MVNRGSLRRLPRIRPIGTQSPSISTSGGLGNRFWPRRPPSYHRHGGILDHHIPCVLRTRYRPREHHSGTFTPGSCTIRRVARDGCSKTFQTGVFARGPRCSPGEGKTGAGGCLRVDERERSPRFSRLPAHHPLSMYNLVHKHATIRLHGFGYYLWCAPTLTTPHPEILRTCNMYRLRLSVIN